MNLIERLQAATEGSRELDAQIWWTYCRKDAAPAFWNGSLGKPIPYDKLPDVLPAGLGRLAVECNAPAFTRSIDAAKSLFSSRVVSWSIGDSPGGPTAWILLDDGTEINGFPNPGKGTPAICACIAALKAQKQ